MGLGNLTIFILQNVRSRAVNDTHAPLRWVTKPRRMLARFDAAPACFDADQFHLLIAHKSAENTDRIRPAAHAGNDHIRQAPHIHQASVRAPLAQSLTGIRARS